VNRAQSGCWFDASESPLQVPLPTMSTQWPQAFGKRPITEKVSDWRCWVRAVSCYHCQHLLAAMRSLQGDVMMSRSSMGLRIIKQVLIETMPVDASLFRAWASACAVVLAHKPGRSARRHPAHAAAVQTAQQARHIEKRSIFISHHSAQRSG